MPLLTAPRPITFFGAVPPSLWGPPPGRLQHRVIYKGGCGTPNADTVDSGLLGVSVDDVVRELTALDGLRQAMAVKHREVMDWCRSTERSEVKIRGERQ